MNTDGLIPCNKSNRNTDSTIFHRKPHSLKFNSIEQGFVLNNIYRLYPFKQISMISQYLLSNSYGIIAACLKEQRNKMTLSQFPGTFHSPLHGSSTPPTADGSQLHPSLGTAPSSYRKAFCSRLYPLLCSSPQSVTVRYENRQLGRAPHWKDEYMENHIFALQLDWQGFFVMDSRLLHKSDEGYGASPQGKHTHTHIHFYK